MGDDDSKALKLKQQYWPELAPAPAPVAIEKVALDAAAQEYMTTISSASAEPADPPEQSSSEIVPFQPPPLGPVAPGVVVRAAPVVASEPKSLLNSYCQKVSKRPIMKNDVTYEVRTVGFSEYQATVTLACLGGEQFAGGVARTRKDAEKMAAEQALKHYAASSGAVAPSAASASTSPMANALGGQALPPELSSIGPKAALNQVLGRVVKGLNADSVSYESKPLPGGYQSVIKMPCLPGDWALQSWAGQICSKKKDAETSAAGFALNALMGHQPFYEAYMAPRPDQSFRMGGIRGMKAQQEKMTSAAAILKLGIMLEDRHLGSCQISPATTLASVRALMGQMGMRGVPSDFLFQVTGVSLPREQEIQITARELLPAVNIVSTDLKRRTPIRLRSRERSRDRSRRSYPY